MPTIRIIRSRSGRNRNAKCAASAPIRAPRPWRARSPRRSTENRLKKEIMATPTSGTPAPTGITLHQKAQVLEIAFADGKSFRLPAEFLRVHSPSAEVRGHGPGQEVLQAGKKNVGIVAVEPVGQYALQLRFSDGHDTGIYSW